MWWSSSHFFTTTTKQDIYLPFQLLFQLLSYCDIFGCNTQYYYLLFSCSSIVRIVFNEDYDILKYTEIYWNILSSDQQDETISVCVHVDCIS